MNQEQQPDNQNWPASPPQLVEPPKPPTDPSGQPSPVQGPEVQSQPDPGVQNYQSSVQPEPVSAPSPPPAAPGSNYSQPLAPQPEGSSVPAAEPYVSNPFLVTTEGLIKILKVNAVPILLSAFYLLIITVIFTAGSLALFDGIVEGLALFLVFLILFPAFAGMFYVIAGASARGEAVTLNQALGRSMSRLLPFILLLIIMSFLTIVGLILLIIPGLYILGRISLAPVVFFEENKGPIEAIQRSFELTKGHALEVLSALLAGGIITGNSTLLGFAGSIAPLVGRYVGLDNLKKTGAPKPQVHWMNFVLPFLVVIFTVGYFALLALPFLASDKGYNDSYNQSDYPYQSDFNSDTRNNYQTDFNDTQFQTPNPPLN